jgi:hypothetical protein
VPDAKARGTLIIEFFASTPPCQHQVFDFVVDASLTEMRAKKAGIRSKKNAAVRSHIGVDLIAIRDRKIGTGAFASKADICSAQTNVRFGSSRHVQRTHACPLGAISGHRNDAQPDERRRLHAYRRLPSVDHLTAMMISTSVFSVALGPHFVHDVVLAHVPDHLQAEIVVRPHFGRRRVINLEGPNSLAEIGGVSADVDHVANAQRTGLEP